MTAADEKGDLALLRALCEYGGHRQEVGLSVWWTIRLPNGDFGNARDLDILLPPYCDTLLGAVLRRLRKDGWLFSLDWDYFDGKPPSVWCASVGQWSEWGGAWTEAQHDNRDPEHAVLALGRAMRDAGVISTDAETKT